jgi:putative ABC transport system permease protein
MLELGPIFRAMRRNKARFGLIAVEVALTLAVVVNCVALIRDAREKMSRSSGFDDENLLIVNWTPFDTAFRDEDYRMNVLDADLAALRATPGVRAVTPTRLTPWMGGGSSQELRPWPSTGPLVRTQIYSADEGLVDTLGVHIVEGRMFTREDVDRDTARVKQLFAADRVRGPDGQPIDKFLQEVVITRAWAEKLWGPQVSYLGKMLEDSDTDQYRVIGVIDPFFNPYGWPIEEFAVFYANFNSSYEGGSQYMVRTQPGQAGAIMRTLEDTLTRTNALRQVQVRRVTDIRYNHFGAQRMVAVLMGLVAILLVIVTALGIVGVTSFLVTERTRQIGTRRALGATMLDIVRYFLIENWMVTTIGIVTGAGLAVALNVALLSVVAGARLGATTIVMGAAVLWLLGLASALVPALRAARTSPAVATRSV